LRFGQVYGPVRILPQPQTLAELIREHGRESPARELLMRLTGAGQYIKAPQPLPSSSSTLAPMSGGTHERLADQHRPHPGRPQALDVPPRLDPALAHQAAVRRDARRPVERVLEPRLERAQVAVVHPDQPASAALSAGSVAVSRTPHFLQRCGRTKTQPES